MDPTKNDGLKPECVDWGPFSVEKLWTALSIAHEGDMDRLGHRLVQQFDASVPSAEGYEQENFVGKKMERDGKRSWCILHCMQTLNRIEQL